MTTQDRIGVENEIKQLEESLQYVTSARGEIQKAYQLSIYNNASMEQLYDLRKQMTSNMTKYLYQGSTSFGNKGGDLLSGFYEFQQNRNYFNKYGRDSLNAQVLEANRNLTTNQRKFLGVNSFNNITPEQAMELQQNLLNAKSNNQTSLIQNGQQISVSEAEELALKMSSISAEQMSVRTKELELLQQRKSIEIEIVKMELEANKLSTQYVKSVALANNEFEQQMFSNSRYLVGNATTQLEDKNSFTREFSLYNDDVLDSIEEFVKKELLDSLNFCSHENVSVKFDKNIIENLHNNMRIVLKMSMDYFK